MKSLFLNQTGKDVVNTVSGAARRVSVNFLGDKLTALTQYLDRL